MSLELLVELGWKSLLLSGLTIALVALARKRSAGEKALIGDAGLMSLLLLPVTTLLLPQIELAPPQALGSALGSFSQAPEPTSLGAAAAGAVASTSRFDWSALGVGLYLVPMVALIAGLALGLVRLRRLYGRARVVEDARWLTALAAVQNRAGVKHGTALLISKDINSPISWGVIRPVITLRQVLEAEELMSR